MIENRSRLLEAGTAAHPCQLDLFAPPAFADACAAHFPVVGQADTSEHGLYGLCHDMRTALNAILGFSEIMTQKLHGPLGHPKYDEYAAHVRFSGQALLTVSDEVLSTLAGRRLTARNARLSPVA
jgi:hypothetical protein